MVCGAEPLSFPEVALHAKAKMDALSTSLEVEAPGLYFEQSCLLAGNGVR